jgi:hypothetical protein
MNKACNQTAQDKSSKTSPCRPSAAKIQLVRTTPRLNRRLQAHRRHPSRDEQAPAAADTRRGTRRLRPPPTPVEGQAGPGRRRHPSRGEQAPAAADTRRAPAARTDNTRRGTSRPVSDMEKVKPNSTRLVDQLEKLFMPISILFLRL